MSSTTTPIMDAYAVYAHEFSIKAKYAPHLDHLADLCIEYSQRRLEGIRVELPHMCLYKSWINQQSKRRGHPMNNMDDCKIFNEATAAVQRLTETPVAEIALVMFKILCGINSIACGRFCPLMVLRPEKTRSGPKFPTGLVYWPLPLEELMRIGNNSKEMSILLLGAGTYVCRILTFNARARERNYQHGDFETSNVERAAEALAKVEHANLDIGQDPVQQGFNSGQFDIVMATDALFTTANLSQSLDNMRILVCPGGSVMLHKLPRDSTWMNYAYGVLSTWWIDVSDCQIGDDLEIKARRE